MRPVAWLTVPLLVPVLAGGCSSTTENPDGSGGAAGASSGGAGGSGAAKSFSDCLSTCGVSADAAKAFKDALTLCACATATPCKADCQVFCTGTPPTPACFACDDPAKSGCLVNNCTGPCETYRTCLASCVAGL